MIEKSFSRLIPTNYHKPIVPFPLSSSNYTSTLWHRVVSYPTSSTRKKWMELRFTGCWRRHGSSEKTRLATAASSSTTDQTLFSSFRSRSTNDNDDCWCAHLELAAKFELSDRVAENENGTTVKAAATTTRCRLQHIHNIILSISFVPPKSALKNSLKFTSV